MFSYYGSKSKVIHLYPKPKYKKIIEPFAGSARYSLRYFDNDILLIDQYDIVIRVWKWLQLCSKNDITSLPIPKVGESLDTYHFDCAEAKWYLGFIINTGSASPRKVVTNFIAQDNFRKIKTYIKFTSRNLEKIRHWDIRLGDYREAKNQEATWFIDPPYMKGGVEYKKNNIDYKVLSGWAKEREGQIIVCGSTKDTWMDFYPMRINQNRGLRKSEITTEAIWSNLPHDFMARQATLF